MRAHNNGINLQLFGSIRDGIRRVIPKLGNQTNYKVVEFQLRGNILQIVPSVCN